MIVTTFESLHRYAWLRPGESSEEAGRTPALYITSTAALPWLESVANQDVLLRDICTITRTIYPSRIIVADGHFMLSWMEAGQQPITVQLLIQEQYQAMLDNNIAATVNSTWTGACWVTDRAYLREWAPSAGARLGIRHEKDYRAVLDHAVRGLCRHLHTAYTPHALAVRNLYIQRLRDQEASPADIAAFEAEYQHRMKRQRKQLGKRRKRNRPSPPPSDDQGLFARLSGAPRDLGSRQVWFPLEDQAPASKSGRRLSDTEDSHRQPSSAPLVTNPDTQPSRSPDRQTPSESPPPPLSSQRIAPRGTSLGTPSEPSSAEPRARAILTPPSTPAAPTTAAAS